MAPITKKSVNKSTKRASNDSSIKRPNKKAKISVESSNEDELDSESSQSSSDDDLDNIVSSDDEDELDNVDQESGNNDSEASGIGSDEDSDGAAETDKTDGNGNHTEQRKLLKERKMQRKSGSEVQHIKSLWERLRVKNPPPPKEVRDKLSNEIWELAKDCISDLVMKHDASRVVQTLIKYASKDRREQIIGSLKGKFYVLATSAYGKYLLVKLLHYGSKKSRQLIIDELHGKLRKLMRHREGAYVVEDLFVLYASHEQRQQMIKEFWGSEYAVFRESLNELKLEDVCASSVEKRNIISKNLIGTITASIEKGSIGFQILHAAMQEYVKIADEKEMSEFIELVHEQFAELVHTPEGANVACTLIAKANAKERKQLLKSLKNHGGELIRNEHGHLVFITALLCVDDTVLMFKTFGPIVKEQLQIFIVEKYGRRAWLYVLLGLDTKYFSPLCLKDLERYIKLSESTSKKPAAQRRQELLNKFAPLYLSTINKFYSTILTENLGSQFVAEVLMSDELYEELGEKEQKSFQSVLDSISVMFKGDISEEEHPIHKSFSTRLLKGLIQGGKWNNKEKKLEPLKKVQGLGTEFAQNFYENIIDSTNLLEWINNADSSFTIVALYEKLSGTAEGKVFEEDLKKIAKDIDTESENNRGARLLSTLIKK